MIVNVETLLSSAHENIAGRRTNVRIPLSKRKVWQVKSNLLINAMRSARVGVDRRLLRLHHPDRDDPDNLGPHLSPAEQ